jgi:hypothetical protein
LAHFTDPVRFEDLIRQLRKREWVVYAKPPFGGPEVVVNYLARYTHRVAISNRRITGISHGRVTFDWKDYAHEHRTRSLTLEVVEFARRFLLHVLPQRFVRIRYYGFLSNTCRQRELRICRDLLNQAASAEERSGLAAEEIRQPFRMPMAPRQRTPTSITPARHARQGTCGASRSLCTIRHDVLAQGVTKPLGATAATAGGTACCGLWPTSRCAPVVHEANLRTNHGRFNRRTAY